jgi:hypothetical protein
MREGFRSLAAILRQAQDDEGAAQDDEGAAQDDEGTVRDDESACPDDESSAHDGDVLELAREVRVFHARVIEAVETAVETLVEDIAADVLGRELLLAPCDIEAIVDRALARFSSEQALRVRVHAGDAARLQCAVPVVADERLRAGDAVIELRDGTVDVSLGTRLSTIVKALR